MRVEHAARRSAAVRRLGSVVRSVRDVRAPASRPVHDPAPQVEPWDPTSTSALYGWCVRNGMTTRPQYLWPVLHCAQAAHARGLSRVAALEFGVAGGNGLLALERATEITSRFGGADVDIFGFDTGAGMPAPVDPRDAPWLIENGYFAMDEDALRARLRHAQLEIGPVADTVPAWTAAAHAPIGFVSFDLDYYSSTVDALRVLDAAPERLLPRIICYFDDIFGYAWTDFVGPRQAIEEFNSSHDTRKIAKLHGLRFELPRDDFFEAWHEKLYVVHVFDHPLYGQREGKVDERWFAVHQLPPS